MTRKLDKFTMIEKGSSLGPRKEKTIFSAQIIRDESNTWSVKIPGANEPKWLAQGDEVVGSIDGVVEVSGPVKKIARTGSYRTLTIRK